MHSITLLYRCIHASFKRVAATVVMHYGDGGTFRIKSVAGVSFVFPASGRTEGGEGVLTSPAWIVHL